MTAQPLTLFDIVPGKRLSDRFTVVGPHRQGGFSTAFEVSEDENEARLELQLFPSGLFDGPEQASEFINGFSPWTNVESPAVAACIEVLDLGADALALISNFPKGESLRQRLKANGPLAHDEVLALGTHLLQGLVEIHGRNLVHGDIKPYTIHVDGVGAELSAQMVDGGVTPGLWAAKDLGEKTALIGTPYYAPIELFGGDSPDVSSDIYNVATVLFECATGVLPWAAKNFLQVFQAKLQDPPSMMMRAPDVEVDADLESAIRQGMLTDRKNRYGTASSFLLALEELS
jgi:serine/threonine protein kinase